jgi:hypothetical protein
MSEKLDNEWKEAIKSEFRRKSKYLSKREYLTQLLQIVCPTLPIGHIDFLVENTDRLKINCDCPHCGQNHQPYNGTGPGQFDILGLNFGGAIRWVLKYMPWDDWIQRFAVPYHDWMSVWGRSSGVSFDRLNFVFEILVEYDIDYFYNKMLKRKNFIQRGFWRFLNGLLLDRLDEICEYFVGSDQTQKDYETTSCNFIEMAA